MILGKIRIKGGSKISKIWENGCSCNKCLTYNRKMEGYKSIYKGFDTMWKLNPGVRTITLTTIANYTCKLLTKENE